MATFIAKDKNGNFMGHISAPTITEAKKVLMSDITSVIGNKGARLIGPFRSEVDAQPYQEDRHYNIGQRIQLTTPVDVGMEGTVPEYVCGRIVAISEDGILVMMDDHFDFLDEWDNVLVFPELEYFQKQTEFV